MIKGYGLHPKQKICNTTITCESSSCTSTEVLAEVCNATFLQKPFGSTSDARCPVKSNRSLHVLS